MTTWRLLVGDVRETLAALPAGSVQTCVTSPPYWGLRDYGTATWDGGDPACDHVSGRVHGGGLETSGLRRDGREHTGIYDAEKATASVQYRDVCGKCGATRIDSQLGLEPTPAAYVANMVAVFAEVWRVLRDDGVCWINLGDSYASGEVGRVDAPSKAPGLAATQRPRSERRIKQQSGCKPKDLVGIPWMVAFALRDAGWYLRSAITWCKGNPMPESVTDRPTKATEMLFLLAKSSRYFYDADAIREGVGESGVVAGADGESQRLVLGQDFWSQETGTALSAVGVRLASAVLNLAHGENDLGLFPFNPEIGQQGSDGNARLPVVHIPVMRRAAAQAARFADGDIPAKQFLQEMDRLCVALPDGDDLKEAWRLALRHIGHINTNRDRSVAINDAGKIGQFKRIHVSNSTARVPLSGRNKRDWWVVNSQPYPDAHFATYPEDLITPCILAGSKPGDLVLDPFTGSGTTGAVAIRHQRSFVGCELNPEYVALARKRIGGVAPMFAQEVA